MAHAIVPSRYCCYHCATHHTKKHTHTVAEKLVIGPTDRVSEWVSDADFGHNDMEPLGKACIEWGFQLGQSQAFFDLKMEANCASNPELWPQRVFSWNMDIFVCFCFAKFFQYCSNLFCLVWICKGLYLTSVLLLQLPFLQICSLHRDQFQLEWQTASGKLWKSQAAPEAFSEEAFWSANLLKMVNAVNMSWKRVLSSLDGTWQNSNCWRFNLTSRFEKSRFWLSFIDDVPSIVHWSHFCKSPIYRDDFPSYKPPLIDSCSCYFQPCLTGWKESITGSQPPDSRSRCGAVLKIYLQIIRLTGFSSK